MHGTFHIHILYLKRQKSVYYTVYSDNRLRHVGLGTRLGEFSSVRHLQVPMSVFLHIKKKKDHQDSKYKNTWFQHRYSTIISMVPRDPQSLFYTILVLSPDPMDAAADATL